MGGHFMDLLEIVFVVFLQSFFFGGGGGGGGKS